MVVGGCAVDCRCVWWLTLMRAALSVEVVLCHALRFVSREARAAAVRLSWFAVWRFEALWGRGWHVGALWA